MQQPKTYRVWVMAAFLGLCISMPVLGDDTATAKEMYQQGVDAFKQNEFETALENFTEAYNLSGKPGILFNLALCQEKLGQTDRAIAYYELYLEEVPDAEDADAVRSKIDALNNPDALPAAPAEASTAETPEKPAEEIQQVNDNSANTATGPLQVEIPPDPNARKYNIIQGLLVGGGTLLLVTGGLTTVAAFRKHSSYEDVCAPYCSDSQVKTVKRLALAADIQMGLGIASLATGIIWRVVYKQKRKRIESQSGAALTFSPVMNASTGGFAVMGRF